MENAFHEEKDGFKWFDESTAISQLLSDDTLFPNSRDYTCNLFGNETKGHTLVLFVNCNDVFAWGYADAEDINTEELEVLYKLWYENQKWGSTKWICLKRNERPQIPIEESMKKEGVWDEVMEALPENRYWKMLKDKKENKNQ